MLLLQLFFNGLLTLPVINYTVSFMWERTIYDLYYIWTFSILFGMFVGLYWVIKTHNIWVCLLSWAAWVGGLFTLLCPVCPVFFLSYLGIFTWVAAFTPYFLAIRIIWIIVLFIGIIILWRSTVVSKDFEIKWSKHSLLNIFLAIVWIGLLLWNQTMALSISNKIMVNKAAIELSWKINQDIANIIAFKTPFYAQELGLDFSNLKNINKSIRSLWLMAPNQWSKRLKLTPEQMKRYVAIWTQKTLTCEFCCWVKTLVTSKWMPTCSCAHSKAMRWTAAYLLQNYPDMSNEEISVELAKQKALFFPKQMAKRLWEQLVSWKYSADIKYLVSQFTEEEMLKLKASAKEWWIKPNIDSPDMVWGC